MATQRLSTENRSRGSVRAAVVALRVRPAVGGTFARACGSVRAAVLALRVRPAVGRSFVRACGSSAPPSRLLGFDPPSAGPSPPTPEVVMSSSRPW